MLTVMLKQFAFPLEIMSFPPEIHVEFHFHEICQSDSDTSCQGEVKEAAPCKSEKVH